MDGIIGSLTGFVGGFFDSILGTGSSIGQAYNGFSDTFAFLNSREGWYRIFMVLFGGLLIIGGLRYGTN
jgi:hypothetical protein